MNKRLITPQQETVLKFCHHDFKGLSQSETAKRLSISQSTVSKILKQIEKVMPQFFPILTKLEIKCYHLFMIEGWPIDEIAEHFELTSNSVYKTLQRARDKGMFFTEAKGRVLSYDESMDAHVKQKF